MHKINTKRVLAAFVVAAAMVGCGSGSDESPSVATTDVPSSAQQSISGLIAYLNELIGTSSDTTEPVLVGDAVLPTDDTAEASN